MNRALVEKRLKLAARARRANIPGLSELSDEAITKQLAEWEFISWNHYYSFFVRGFGLYLEKLKPLYTSDCLVTRLALRFENGRVWKAQLEYNDENGKATRIGVTAGYIEINGEITEYVSSPVYDKLQFFLNSLCESKNRVIIGIISLRYEADNEGHAAVFIYNKRKRAFIYYDPHGSQRDAVMARIVKEYVADRVFNSLAYSDLSLYSDGVQRSDVTMLIKEITGQEGFCYAWAALIIETALNLGPTYISVRNIVARLGREPRYSLAVKLLRFIRHVSKLNVNKAQIARIGPKLPGRTWEEIPVSVARPNVAELKEVIKVENFDDAMRHYYKAEKVKEGRYSDVYQSVFYRYRATRLVSAERYVRNYYDQRFTDAQYDRAFEVFEDISTGQGYVVTTIDDKDDSPNTLPIDNYYADNINMAMRLLYKADPYGDSKTMYIDPYGRVYGTELVNDDNHPLETVKIVSVPGDVNYRVMRMGQVADRLDSNLPESDSETDEV